ncbi:TetR/AcrR family transcriptional regulator [Parapedobacter sp. DT-150]|uniref:TetR/AcrR family transcriptional regulator n=1 Tax=Parapedobacter sp. DT-150 TaxID=3396162 RepID=UPI003F1CADCA
MATPRKKYKVRDRDATMRALKDAVGDILRETGFHGLRTTAIARRVGRDKNIIRYHFGGLGQLLSEYVREKDYWPPFFERFRPTEPVSAREVEAAFIELMQENFRHFNGDREMQKVILWQASEHHPVMRSASARREAEGRQLIGLTDQWFMGTDVHFGAVLAIVLGGTYFPILQGSAGNGPVCGMDTGQCRDRDIIERTIGQIIQWAWRAAAESKKGTEMKELNYEYELLENLAATRIKPGRQGDQPDTVLLAEARRLEALLLAELLRLDNETQMRLFLKTHLNRLVTLCNRLYDPQSPSNPDAEALLGIMDALRRAVSGMLPEEVALPELFRNNMTRDFEGRWKQMRGQFADMGIDTALLDIMEVPLQRFADKDRTATWMAFQYLRKYMEGLEGLTAAGVLDDWLVGERLIGLGFNHARFAAHLAQGIRSRGAVMDSHDRREYLLGTRQRVLQVHRLTMLRFDRDTPPMSEEMIRWLDAEIGGTAGIAKRHPNMMKLNTRFKATQLALWQKLLYDHGIYDEANLDLLSEKVAYCFTTKGQESLSPASIKSKFYTKDADAIRTIRKLIDDIRKDLDDYG